MSIDTGASLTEQDILPSQVRHELQDYSQRITVDDIGHGTGHVLKMAEKPEALQNRIKDSLSYISDHSSEFTYHLPLAAKSGQREGDRSISMATDQSTEIDQIFDFLRTQFPFQVVAGISKMEDIDQMKKVLGMLSDRQSLPKTTQFVRRYSQIAESTGFEESDREGLEKMGKLLLGMDPNDTRKFYKKLNDLYDDVDFSLYPTNAEATKRETAMLVSLIAQSEQEKPTVVEIGCGTGRIPNHLSEVLSPDQVGDIIGIDPSETNLEHAKQTDSSKLVKYSVGTLTQTGLADESVDMAIVIGRTMTHLRNRTELVAAVKEWQRILKPGGKVAFDLPDNQKGIYGENRRKYAAILQNLHIPVSEQEAISYYDRVVDGPTGDEVVFDRFVPDLSERINKNSSLTLQEYLEEESGLAIETFSKAPIAGWEGAENMYYLALKPAKREK